MILNAELVRVSLRHDRLPIPIKGDKCLAGTVVKFKEQPELILGTLEIPFLGDFDGSIITDNDAMLPTYSQGCVLGLIRLKYLHVLSWGDCYYIVDKELKCYLRRIYPGKNRNAILLIADNPDQKKYPPTTKRWTDLESIFKVKVVFEKAR